MQACSSFACVVHVRTAIDAFALVYIRTNFIESTTVPALTAMTGPLTHAIHARRTLPAALHFLPLTLVDFRAGLVRSASRVPRCTVTDILVHSVQTLGVTATIYGQALIDLGAAFIEAAAFVAIRAHADVSACLCTHAHLLHTSFTAA